MKNKKLVTGIFKNSDDAARAVSKLVQMGIPRDDINVILSDKSDHNAFGIQTQTKVGEGAAVGGALGGAVGAIIAGFTAVGAIATGGVGLLVAGPIVAALAGGGLGATAGGLIGGLIGWGVPEHEVKFFQNALEKGSVLVGVKAAADRRDSIQKALESCGAMNPTATTAAPAAGGNGQAQSLAETNGLGAIFRAQLKDVYYAEQQLVAALPEMRDAAWNDELRRAFADHLAQTQYHVRRIELIFDSLGEKAKTEKCPAINGIIAEAKELMKLHNSASPERDAALICGAQKAEHYELATYGCLLAYARTLGYVTATDLLGQTLDEERAADRLLTSIAEDGVNETAAASNNVDRSARREDLAVAATPY